MEGPLMVKYPKLFRKEKYPLKKNMNPEYLAKSMKEFNEWYESLNKEEREILHCDLLLY